MAITRFLHLSSPSGSLGGTTFSHNKGGSYLRTRKVPTNPSTSQQQIVRNAMAVLAPRWGSVLTGAQREAWETYALNVLLPNRLGDMINVGGIGMFARGNISRIQTGSIDYPIVDDGPTEYNIGSFTPPVFTTLSEATQNLTMAFTNTDDWAGESGSAMMVYLSRPVGVAVNSFKGPYRFAGIVDGDDAVPPTSPATIPSPFVVESGQKIFGQVRVTRVDGRLSGSFRSGLLVSA